MAVDNFYEATRAIVDAMRKLTEAVKAGNVVLEKMRGDMRGGKDGR